MMYRVRRSFVDPFTGRIWLRGKPYLFADEQRADYLERHGLIERMDVDTAPAGQKAGADASGEKARRRKARR